MFTFLLFTLIGVTAPQAAKAQEVVNGGGGCQQWFMFWCVDGGSGYSDSYNYNYMNQPQANPYQPYPMNQPYSTPRPRSYGGRYAPILAPFTNAFNQCAPGCTYTNWGIWGDMRHQHKHSCHNSGSAVDVHAIRCGGANYAAGTSRFNGFVSCMHGRNGLYTIYGNGEHRHHAHISLESCEVGQQGKIRTR